MNYKELVKKGNKKFGKPFDITMEECAELTIACSKQLRNKPNDANLLEELGDVYYCINRILQYKKWSIEDLERMATIKLLSRHEDFKYEP